VLAVGDVDYGASAWPALQGTATELAVVERLAPGESTLLTKGEATVARLAGALPQAGYAHIATHGAFNADELANERRRQAEALRNWHEGLGDTRRVAARNPLGFVGVVLAAGEVMGGLSILDFDLEQIRLVTLSACESGLGKFTGGKGVENLQLAFHLAGCPNVVASLWKVNDAATAALMAKFYHELWVEKKEPLAALREAQLLIYHHPELIPDLAGERGAPKFKDAVAVKASVEPSGRRARTDTKLWAAFVLSGVGR
jgi:CHAT domain-containing protein